MACSIPQPTTEGVIRPVPTSVDCQFLVDHSTVKEVRRLTNRDGTRSQAIKLTFFSPQLPSSIKLDYQEFVLHAYVPPVRRCTTCSKLGHLKAQCRSTVPVCPRCGSRGQRLACVPTNFAASTAEALTRQPTKAAHNNVCALLQIESGLGPLSHTRKP